VLFGMGCGPLMLYSGQEVGEPAAGQEGFGGDDVRTTIFDYWSMPEFTKWTNGGKFDGARLSDEQKALREWYGNLIHLMHQPAFAKGEFYGLNHANNENPHYGRIDGETASGHWLYSYLRHDKTSGQAFLVVANFHGNRALEDIHVRLPDNALEWLGKKDASSLQFTDRLASNWSAQSPISSLPHDGITLPKLDPLSAMIVEISTP